MPSNVGYGASVGNNFGAGGVIFVSNVSPSPNTLIGPGGTVNFTLGVQGGLISLSTVRVTIVGENGFDGSVPAFGAHYASGSTYHYNASVNGYDFSFARTSGFLSSDVLVVITGSTTDGATTTQTYSLLATPAPQYPLTPFGSALVTIPIGKFSGEATSGLLSGAAGQVFVTPGLDVANTSVSLDVDDVQVLTHTADHYDIPQTDNSRPLLWGPPKSVVTFSISGVTSHLGVIRIATSSPHGFISGQTVTVSGVVGVPANGSWKVSVVSSVTFDLVGSVFSGAYVSGGLAGPPVFPPPDDSAYTPVLNDPNFTFLKTTQASVVGELTDTNSGNTTVILY